MRVVIADDSGKVRGELRQMMARYGWQVVGEAENGLEALDLVQRLKPDLLTLDIVMPEMDGIECYRKLRQLNTSTRCLIISVLATEPRVVQAFEDEIYSTHFLKKPINERELKEKTEEVMKHPPMPWPTKNQELPSNPIIEPIHEVAE